MDELVSSHTMGQVILLVDGYVKYQEHHRRKADDSNKKEAKKKRKRIGLPKPIKEMTADEYTRHMNRVSQQTGAGI